MLRWTDNSSEPLHFQLNSYLVSMSYSGCEAWAGDNTGMLHSFSMQNGSFKSLSQFDVGHTALITGIHRSPGSLYTCSSDRTVKVRYSFVCLTIPLSEQFKLRLSVCFAGTHPLCTSKDNMHTAAPRWSQWG